MSRKRIGLAVLGGIGLIVAVFIVLIVWVGDEVATDDPRVPTRQSENNLTQPANETQSPTPTLPLLPFPILQGTNLRGDAKELPTDLDGEPKLIVVAYDSNQQSLVDEWLPYLEALNEAHPDLRGYYLPILPKSAADSALFIIGGMSVAAKDNRDRERTLIVFTDVEEFNHLVEVENMDTIRLFLVDSIGNIIWTGQGNYSAATLAQLESVLATRESSQ